MSKLGDRLKRLLDFADNPVPGDRVRIGQGARQAALRGRTGVVTAVWTYGVKVDGETHPLTPKSLELDDED